MREKLKNTLCGILIAGLAVFAACNNEEASVSGKGSTGDETSTAESAEAKKEPVNTTTVCFDMGEEAVADGVLYYIDSGKLFKTDKNVYKPEMLIEKADSFCICEDKIYYTHTGDSNGKTGYYSADKDGSGPELFYSADEGEEVLMKREGKLYIYATGEENKLFVAEPGGASKEYLTSLYSILGCTGDGRVYFLDNSSYEVETLCCYDTVKAETKIVFEKELFYNRVFKYGDNMFFTVPEESRAYSGITVYKINRKTGAGDVYMKIKTDVKCSFIKCFDGMIFYQDYDIKNPGFKTYAASVKDKKVICFENLNCKLYEQHDHRSTVMRGDCGDVVYDRREEKLKVMKNVPADSTELRYCDSDFCLWNSADSAVVEKPELSDDFPESEAFKVKLSEEVPDGEYITAKKYIYNVENEIIEVPQINLDSDDARAVNNAIYRLLPDNICGSCYRYRVFDKYLTLFTAMKQENQTYRYNIYTFELDTGKLLDKDAVIALVADDKEDFKKALVDEHKNLQRPTFESGVTDFEAEVLNTVKKNTHDYEITDDDINDFTDSIDADEFDLGYYGDNTVICAAGFISSAGGTPDEHIFDFSYK